MAQKYHLAARDIMQNSLDIHERRKKEEDSKGSGHVITLNRSSSSIDKFQFSNFERVTFDEQDEKIFQQAAERAPSNSRRRNELYFTSLHTTLSPSRNRNREQKASNKAESMFQTALTGAYSVLGKLSEEAYLAGGKKRDQSISDSGYQWEHSYTTGSEVKKQSSTSNRRSRQNGESPPGEVGPVLLNRYPHSKNDPLYVSTLRQEEDMPSMLRSLKDESETSSIESLKKIASKDDSNPFGRHRFGDFDSAQSLVNAMADTLERKIKISTHDSVNSVEKYVRRISDLVCAIREAAEKAERLERGALPSVVGPLPWAALNANLVDQSFFKDESHQKSSAGNYDAITKERYHHDYSANKKPHGSCSDQEDEDADSQDSTTGGSSRFSEYRYDITRTSQFDAMKELEKAFSSLYASMKEFIEVTCASAVSAHNENMFKLMEVDTKHINWLKREHERILSQVRSSVRSQVQATLRSQRVDGSQEQGSEDDALHMATLRQKLEAEATRAKLAAESIDLRREKLARYALQLRRALARVSKSLGVSMDMIPIPPGLSQEDINEIEVGGAEGSEEGASESDTDSNREDSESEDAEDNQNFTNEITKRLGELESAKQEVDKYYSELVDEREQRQVLEEENRRLKHLLKFQGDTDDQVSTARPGSSQTSASVEIDYHHQKMEENEYNDQTRGKLLSMETADKQAEDEGADNTSHNQEVHVTEATSPASEGSQDQESSFDTVNVEANDRTDTDSKVSLPSRNMPKTPDRQRLAENHAILETREGISRFSNRNSSSYSEQRCMSEYVCAEENEQACEGRALDSDAIFEEKHEGSHTDAESGSCATDVEEHQNDSQDNINYSGGTEKVQIHTDSQGIQPDQEKISCDGHAEMNETGSDRAKTYVQKDNKVESIQQTVGTQEEKQSIGRDQIKPNIEQRSSEQRTKYNEQAVREQRPTIGEEKRSATTSSGGIAQVRQFSDRALVNTLKTMERLLYTGDMENLRVNIQRCKDMVLGEGSSYERKQTLPPITKKTEPTSKVTESTSSSPSPTAVPVVNIDLEGKEAERRNSITAPEKFWHDVMSQKLKASNKKGRRMSLSDETQPTQLKQVVFSAAELGLSTDHSSNKKKYQLKELIPSLQRNEVQETSHAENLKHDLQESYTKSSIESTESPSQHHQLCKKNPSNRGDNDKEKHTSYGKTKKRSSKLRSKSLSKHKTGTTSSQSQSTLTISNSESSLAPARMPMAKLGKLSHPSTLMKDPATLIQEGPLSSW